MDRLGNISDITLTVNETLIDYNLTSTLSPYLDYVIGCIVVATGVTSIGLNLLVLLTIRHRSKKCEAVELFIVNMAACDLLQSLLCLPYVAFVFFNHGLSMGRNFCTAEGFLVFLFGLVAIWNLTMMSVVRYVKTMDQRIGVKVTKAVVLRLIVGCYVFSAAWCVAPLVGWGEYGPEPYGISCSINWISTPLSYITSLFVTCYGLPVVVMVYCYSGMVYHVRKMTINTAKIVKKKQTYMSKMAFLMCVCFLVSWTPYAVTALLRISGVHRLPLVLTLGSPVLAKTSLWHNPLVYFFVVRRFRKDVYRCLRAPSSLRHYETGITMETVSPTQPSST